MRTQEADELVKYMLSKQENLNWILRTQGEKPGTVLYAHNPRTGEANKGRSLTLAVQPLQPPAGLGQ